jgi:hypothetical protein
LLDLLDQDLAQLLELGLVQGRLAGTADVRSPRRLLGRRIAVLGGQRLSVGSPSVGTPSPGSWGSTVPVPFANACLKVWNFLRSRLEMANIIRNVTISSVIMSARAISHASL